MRGENLSLNLCILSQAGRRSDDSPMSFCEEPLCWQLQPCSPTHQGTLMGHEIWVCISDLFNFPSFTPVPEIDIIHKEQVLQLPTRNKASVNTKVNFLPVHSFSADSGSERWLKEQKIITRNESMRILLSSEVQSMQREEWDLQNPWAGPSFTPPPLFKLSVPSPAHSAHTSSEGDTGLSFLQHIPSSPDPCVSGQTSRAHSYVTPAKLKFNFHLGCQPGRKKTNGILREAPASSPVSSPWLSVPWTCPLPGPALYFAVPSFCSFLPFQNLLF